MQLPKVQDGGMFFHSRQLRPGKMDAIVESLRQKDRANPISRIHGLVGIESRANGNGMDVEECFSLFIRQSFRHSVPDPTGTLFFSPELGMAYLCAAPGSFSFFYSILY